MKIGTANGRKVMWNINANTVTVYGTLVMITGVDTYEKAIEVSKRNLKNFKESK